MRRQHHSGWPLLTPCTTFSWRKSSLSPSPCSTFYLTAQPSFHTNNMVNEKVVATERLPSEFTSIFPRRKDRRSHHWNFPSCVGSVDGEAHCHPGSTILRVIALVQIQRAVQSWSWQMQMQSTDSKSLMLGCCGKESDSDTLWIWLWTETSGLQHPLLFLQQRAGAHPSMKRPSTWE